MLNLGETSAALVYDTSVFGDQPDPWTALSSISQTAGSLMYSGALVDYRKHQRRGRSLLPCAACTTADMAATAKTRESPSLFIGYANSIRGYDVGSFSVDECEITATSSCAQFDRLIGSRMLVSNIELRAPLIGLFRSVGDGGGTPSRSVSSLTRASPGRPPPNRLFVEGGDRDWSRSVGATIRFNAFGFAVGEIDYVRPLDRPGRGGSGSST